jgi:hypothetical protein
LGRRLGQELLEVFEKIRCGVEELRDLSVYILNRFGLSLVSL